MHLGVSVSVHQCHMGLDSPADSEVASKVVQDKGLDLALLRQTCAGEHAAKMVADLLRSKTRLRLSVDKVAKNPWVIQALGGQPALLFDCTVYLVCKVV